MTETIQRINYTFEGNKDIGKDVTVYALSTCGFCRRALQFLRDADCKFKFVYVDKLPYETKQQLKEELQDRYEKRVVFPYLVIDDSDVLAGFVEEDWKNTLGL
ncbi:MAG: glutaredoxin [Candidatus Lokiarchaeota archaeon]|nr:glutaredoxin [Candidatus Lokiarchaeota archaeon]